MCSVKRFRNDLVFVFIDGISGTTGSNDSYAISEVFHEPREFAHPRKWMDRCVLEPSYAMSLLVRGVSLS
jgi:hypothetical protein